MLSVCFSRLHHHGGDEDLTAVIDSTSRLSLRRSWLKKHRSQRAVSKLIHEKCGRKRCASTRDNRSPERIVKQRLFKHSGELQTGLRQESVHQEPMRKITGLSLSVSTFCIKFGNQGPRVWRKNGEHRIQVGWSPV